MNLDIKEKGGTRNGQQQVSERRLFMQLLAFGDCREPGALSQALNAARLPAVLYQDVNDVRGIGLLTWHEDPEFFVSTLRPFLLGSEFAKLGQKAEYTMLGRTYSLGLTSRGRSLLENAAKLQSVHEARVTARIGTEGRVQLLSLLERVARLS